MRLLSSSVGPDCEFNNFDDKISFQKLLGHGWKDLTLDLVRKNIYPPDIENFSLSKISSLLLSTFFILDWYECSSVHPKPGCEVYTTAWICSSTSTCFRKVLSENISKNFWISFRRATFRTWPESLKLEITAEQYQLWPSYHFPIAKMVAKVDFKKLSYWYETT